MGLILGWLVFAIVVAIIAPSRGRSAFGWFLLSLLISPVLGLILVLALPKRGSAAVSRDESGAPITAATHVRCPDCREVVRKDAKKCKHCGAALVPVAMEDVARRVQVNRAEERKVLAITIAISGAVLLALAGYAMTMH